MVRTKVFVGNLSFKTKAAELAGEFSVAGKVVEANIITRGPRSLGYGFVAMESEEEAAKAVALLNKKTIDGRDINVEVAKPRDEAKIAEKRAQHAENRNQGDGDNGRGRGGRGRGRGRGGRGGRGGYRGGRGRPYRSRGGGPPSSENDNGDRRVRPPRNYQPRDLSNRTPSPTTLFVANLPFAVDDNGLSELFQGLKVSKAHVVKNRNGRSKGFGFVTFESEEDQKTALSTVDKKVVDGRELIVKIALTSENNNTTNNNNQKTDSAQPSADAPKTETAAEAPKTEAAT